MSREIAPVPRSRGAFHPDPRAQRVIDVALGVAGVTAGVTIVAARTASKVVGPVARLLWQPPVVARRYQPATIVAGLADSGRAEREALLRRVAVMLDAWVPALTEALVERLDLTRLVEQHVSLDELVGTVDLDAAVARVDLDAAVRRVDLDAAVARVAIDAILDRIDLDEVASRLDVDAVVARADLDKAVARVDIDAILDRIDLDDVASRLDVDAVVARADLDKAVARVDIDAVLDRVDLDEVASRLDVDAVVARADLDAAVERVDIDKIIARVDIVKLVDEVMDEIDLPGIIRESTGSMASETVRGVRMTGISADDAISRAVDRALFRRRHRPGPDGAAP